MGNGQRRAVGSGQWAVVIGHRVAGAALLLIATVMVLAIAALGGCASPGGQFTDHSATSLRQEGPSSATPSLFQQDGGVNPGSRSMQGGFGPSQVIADVQGVSAASTISQNTGTVRLPYDLNRDGVLGEGEIVVLNVSGNSDFAVQDVTFTYYDAENNPLSTVRVSGVSSLNSPIGPSVAPMIAQTTAAYAAASADRRAEYDRYMATAETLIREGRIALSDALAAGLKILLPVPSVGISAPEGFGPSTGSPD